MQFSWILPISSSMATTAPFTIPPSWPSRSPSVTRPSPCKTDGSGTIDRKRLSLGKNKRTSQIQQKKTNKGPKDPRIDTSTYTIIPIFSFLRTFFFFVISFSTCWAFSSIIWVFPRWRYCWDRLSSNNKVCQSQNTRLSSILKARHPHCHWQEPQEWTLPRLVSLASGYPEAPQCFAGEKLPKSMRTTFVCFPALFALGNKLDNINTKKKCASCHAWPNVFVSELPRHPQILLRLLSSLHLRNGTSQWRTGLGSIRRDLAAVASHLFNYLGKWQTHRYAAVMYTKIYTKYQVNSANNVYHSTSCHLTTLEISFIGFHEHMWTPFFLPHLLWYLCFSNPQNRILYHQATLQPNDPVDPFRAVIDHCRTQQDRPGFLRRFIGTLLPHFFVDSTLPLPEPRQPSE